MKTKQVPAIVMLLAGLLTCVISIVQHMEFGKFVKTLFIVVICFYILGCIVKMILDKNFAEMQEETTEDTEAEEETENTQEDQKEEKNENIESDGEEENKAV